VWLVVVLVLVVFIRIKVVFRIKGDLHPDSEVLEKTWTIIPIVILLRIAFPRIYLLCLQDSNQSPASTVKVVRNQWNWQRETSESVDHLLDSDILDFISSYDTPLIVESSRNIRVLTIRTDVLHSLGIPRIGIKLDASPGRISITMVESSSPGVLLGSCYELCGRGHRAIPLHIVSI